MIQRWLLVLLIALASGCATQVDLLAERVAEAIAGSDEPRGQLLVLPRTIQDEDLAREAYRALRDAGVWCRLFLVNQADFHGNPYFSFELYLSARGEAGLEAELRGPNSDRVLLTYETP